MNIPKNLRTLKTNFEKADGLGIRQKTLKFKQKTYFLYNLVCISQLQQQTRFSNIDCLIFVNEDLILKKTIEFLEIFKQPCLIFFEK